MKRGRRLTRVPVKLEVEYRTTGNFLVAYSTNLSKGGLFLQAAEPLPVGSRLTLLLHVRGVEKPVTVDAHVAWVRAETSPEGHPAGMGLEFAPLEEKCGELIDRIVGEFTRIRMMVVGSAGAARTLIVHYLHSICTCDITEASFDEVAELPQGPADLLVVALEPGVAGALKLLGALKARLHAPIIALCDSEEAKLSAKGAGADEALTLPPAFGDLQTAVIDTLARPRLL